MKKLNNDTQIPVSVISGITIPLQKCSLQPSFLCSYHPYCFMKQSPRLFCTTHLHACWPNMLPVMYVYSINISVCEWLLTERSFTDCWTQFVNAVYNHWGHKDYKNCHHVLSEAQNRITLILLWTRFSTKQLPCPTTWRQVNFVFTLYYISGNT